MTFILSWSSLALASVVKWFLYVTNIFFFQCQMIVRAPKTKIKRTGQIILPQIVDLRSTSQCRVMIQKPKSEKTERASTRAKASAKAHSIRLSFFFYAPKVVRHWHDQSGFMTWKSDSALVTTSSISHQKVPWFVNSSLLETSDGPGGTPDRWRQTDHTSQTYKNARNIAWIFSFVLTVVLLTRLPVKSRNSRKATILII